jgi:deoxyribodipyrimidine photo-lyase
MQNERIYKLNQTEIQNGKVLYWMDRDMRTEDNWALFHASQIAQESKQNLVVVYNLVCNFLNGGYRQWDFKINGLKELEKSFALKNISFIILVDKNGTETPKIINNFIKKYKIKNVVTDFSPLHISQNWKKEIAKNKDIYFAEVDTHNIVPVRIASEKQEYGAYTLRPKIYKLLPYYLKEVPKIEKQKSKINITEKNNWTKIEKLQKYDLKNPPVPWTQAGEKNAHKFLGLFIQDKIKNYALERNDALKDMQSGLSPFLHYGMISSARIAIEILEKTKLSIGQVLNSRENKAKIKNNAIPTLGESVGAFLEELIIRKELSDNFCLYNKNYDNEKSFPLWAQKSHEIHNKDKREYLYTLEEFENAKTHDDLWNACQNEMLQTGKMHGYMRMYWAKKILEWTKNPKQAMQYAIYLNDKYELDGRDPNGYAGIAWSIGGVHDRAWFPRPIFGTIRYMARSGCEKKFDAKEYIKKYNNQKLF